MRRKRTRRRKKKYGKTDKKNTEIVYVCVYRLRSYGICMPRIYIYYINIS